MASTYSPNLRLELIGTGEQQGTWGSTTNTNLGTLLEEAIGGYVSVTVSNVADTTLTTNNGSADQSRNMVINLTGTITATRNVICPAIEKLYVVKNATTGGFSVTFKVSGQTGVTIPNGAIEFIYVDGTDARSITGTIAIQDANSVAITGGSITGITDLAVADGGTGASDAATARTNLGIGTIGTQNANAVAITGGSVIANASSLSVRDSDGSNILTIAVGSNLTANRVFTLTTGDAARTLDVSAGNVTISTAGAALIDDADASAQRTTLGLGTIATQNANNVSVTGGSITGITDLALADGGTGASLADPNANAVLGWNDTAGVMRFFTAGTGIEINATSNTISSTAVGGGNYAMQVYTNTTPGGVTWTKPANLVAIKVTVVGGGGGTATTTSNITGGAGGGGTSVEYIPAASIPGPVTVTVGAGGGTSAPVTGGTSSFGVFLSATGGAGGGVSGTPTAGAGGAGGAGSGGTYNLSGGSGGTTLGSSPGVPMGTTPDRFLRLTGGGAGGGSSIGAGGTQINFTTSFSGPPSNSTPYGPTRSANAGLAYGGGASGSVTDGPSATGASGGQGIVIVEEFY